MPFTASDICKIILAIILPPLGVFLERGCGADLLINICLTILGWLPGIIHALYVFSLPFLPFLPIIYCPPSTGIHLDDNCSRRYRASSIYCLIRQWRRADKDKNNNHNNNNNTSRVSEASGEPGSASAGQTRFNATPLLGGQECSAITNCYCCLDAAESP
ncbi:hypothetical protein ASPZODRAFT_12521 [Penicilliopsis zonata CBS 506.65]|uniref:Plasma membrane proteolipid 3 n=1 Tax=Penicilliopsis zonata CBS 506.65 TaxID=1073090 RepID=A0A1L9SWX6_9EURO|nr:hypothetical protein ASPZODRAFT_12521 [Penicilliopsis zonata CBS 506.65]OJJ51708.1 hypothetical protein ASPZODRAFT_12521 [Penicilliopsis zonata CBS 506.65]